MVCVRAMCLLAVACIGLVSSGEAAAVAAKDVKLKYDYELGSTTVSEIYLRAGKWAQSLDADPLRIEYDLKMKGVKHYVEYISMLHEMQPTANETVRAWAQKALRDAHQITTQPAYHDNVMNGARLHKTKPKKFRADSISYLRACMIFMNEGLDVSYYRQRIAELKPILDQHVPTRGIMQRLAFGLLYDELDLEAGPSMQASFEMEMRRAWAVTSIATRKTLDWYIEPNITPSRIYEITHEVFETTNTGNHPFTLGEDDRLYGLEVLVQLMDHKHAQMNSRRERSLDADHLCELVMSYACFADTRQGLQDPYRSQPDPGLVLPEHHVDALVRSMIDILPRQTASGSFGTLFTKQFEDLNKRYHKNPNHDAQIGAALHCTSVCLRACSLIYRFPQIQARVFALEPSSGPVAPAINVPNVAVADEPQVARGGGDETAYTVGVGYGGRNSVKGGFVPSLTAPATKHSVTPPTTDVSTIYRRRGRSDEDLSPSSALNDPIRSEDILRQVTKRSLPICITVLHFPLFVILPGA